MTTSSAHRPNDASKAQQKRQRRLHLRVPVTPAEKSHITWGSRSTKLSIAGYLRQLGLGKKPRAVADYERVHRLLLIHGDVGRFGGLLKLWLTDDPKLDLFDRGDLRALLECVRQAQLRLHRYAERAIHRPSRAATRLGDPFVKEDNPPPRAHDLRVPVLPGENAIIKDAASTRGVSTACYLRDRALAYRPLTSIDGAVLYKLQASVEGLNQAGGLLKRWLVDAPELRHASADEVLKRVRRALPRAERHLLDLQAHAEIPRAGTRSSQKK